MLKVLLFECDGCKQQNRFTYSGGPALTADAEGRMAQEGWLVKFIAKRTWHFCPACRKQDAAERVGLQAPTGPADL